MTGRQPDSIALLITTRTRDLGEFDVRRSLPDKARQRVGPFIFFDHMGPAHFSPGSGVAVRPHPHIGLATITYLFDGVIVHRDSLGYVQPITRGAVNWMTAGKGIVHSERSPPELVKSGSRLHGVQAWIALPTDLEETEPRFEHYAQSEIPSITRPGVQLTVIAGTAYGGLSPVQTCSETVYVEANMQPGAALESPRGVDEMAVYVVSGEARVDSLTISAGTMAVLSPGASVSVLAAQESRVMLLGGATLSGERIIWWNFVSSSRDRLSRAKADWLNKRFDEVPGDSEFIPLPDKK